MRPTRRCGSSPACFRRSSSIWLCGAWSIPHRSPLHRRRCGGCGGSGCSCPRSCSGRAASATPGARSSGSTRPWLLYAGARRSDRFRPRRLRRSLRPSATTARSTPRATRSRWTCPATASTRTASPAIFVFAAVRAVRPIPFAGERATSSSSSSKAPGPTRSASAGAAAGRAEPRRFGRRAAARRRRPTAISAITARSLKSIFSGRGAAWAAAGRPCFATSAAQAIGSASSPASRRISAGSPPPRRCASTADVFADAKALARGPRPRSARTFAAGRRAGAPARDGPALGAQGGRLVDGHLPLFQPAARRISLSSARHARSPARAGRSRATQVSAANRPVGRTDLLEFGRLCRLAGRTGGGALKALGVYDDDPPGRGRRSWRGAVRERLSRPRPDAQPAPDPGAAGLQHAGPGNPAAGRPRGSASAHAPRGRRRPSHAGRRGAGVPVHWPARAPANDRHGRAGRAVDHYRALHGGGLQRP